jgi:hypothetical protein
MDNLMREQSLSRPSIRRVVVAGLAGGAVLNLIDTPLSVLVMVPRLREFTDAHQLQAHMLTGPWFLLAHFLLSIGIAWLYALAAGPYGKGYKTALACAGIVLVLNRALGFANVLMGLMPLDIFLGFSASFALGVFLAGLAGAWILDTSINDRVRTQPS